MTAHQRRGAHDLDGRPGGVERGDHRPAKAGLASINGSRATGGGAKTCSQDGKPARRHGASLVPQADLAMPPARCWQGPMGAPRTGLAATACLERAKAPWPSRSGTAATATSSMRLPFFYGWLIVAVVFVSMGIGVNVGTASSWPFPPILGEFGWERGVTAGAFSFGFIVSGCQPTDGSPDGSQRPAAW